MTPEEAFGEIGKLKTFFPVLDDTSMVRECWENLVARYRVSGKNAHDARFVAAMKAHGIDQFMTLDKEDLRRYDGIKVVSPGSLLADPHAIG
jgi:predicted nucleic acid-binding protein